MLKNSDFIEKVPYAKLLSPPVPKYLPESTIKAKEFPEKVSRKRERKSH